MMPPCLANVPARAFCGPERASRSHALKQNVRASVCIRRGEAHTLYEPTVQLSVWLVDVTPGYRRI